MALYFEGGLRRAQPSRRWNRKKWKWGIGTIGKAECGIERSGNGECGIGKGRIEER